MKLRIERPHVEAMINAFPRLAGISEQLRFGNSAELAFSQLQDEEVTFLRELYAAGDTDQRARAAQIHTLQDAMNDGGERYDGDDIEPLVPAIARYLAKDAIRGWMFSAAITGKPMAWVVTRIDYTPASGEESGRVLIELKANTKGRLASVTVIILPRDLANRTVVQIFAAKGYLKETAELILLNCA